MARSRRAATLVALGAVVGAGCTFGEQEVPPGRERPVVHSVLNPHAGAVTVLVERTLTGRFETSEELIADAQDPIRSGGGLPISGARVILIDSAGNSAIADEVRLPRSGTSALPAEGTGVYRITNLAGEGPFPGGAPPPGLRVVHGGRYRLRVEAPDAEPVTGDVSVPGDPAAPPGENFSARTFNRDRDTLALAWPAVPGARAYAVQVETPYGSFYLFTDSTTLRLTGGLRNLFAERLPRVFQAGFTQYLYVAAVDSNYYDYYRSRNSPFTGTGIINRLRGGIGLFGAYVPVLSRAIFVRADDRDPLDGRYVARAYNGQESLRLWVDTRAGGVAEVTGAYRLATDEQYGVVGTLEGTRLRLRAILRDDARFIFRTLEGTASGDTIRVELTGVVAGNDDGQRTFVRTPAP